MKEPTQTIRVDVERLDDVLWRLKLDVVDFYQAGRGGSRAERFGGRGQLVARRFAAGDSDRGAGYSDASVGLSSARDCGFAVGKNYCWYSLKADGTLQAGGDGLGIIRCKFGGMPTERAESIRKMLTETEAA